MLIYLLVYALGFFTHFLNEQISNYVQRPILQIDYNTAVFSEEEDNHWTYYSFISFENKGKTQTSLNIRSIELNLPDCSKRPLIFKINKVISLPALTQINDTININFPDIFNKYTLDSIPKLGGFRVEVINLYNNKNIIFEYDSNKIKYRFAMSQIEGDNFIDTRNYPPKPSHEEILFNSKQFIITYKGKQYSNWVIPKSVNVYYEMIDDKIHIKYLHESPNIKLGKLITYPQVWFNFHPKIRDKIIFYNESILELTIEKRGKHDISYETMKFISSKSKTQYIYVL